MFFILYNFFIQQAKAAIFGGFLLFLIIATHFYYPFHESFHVFDFLFLSAVFFQICLLLLKKESKKEFLIIIIFHILAMIMEIFKTSSAIGAWNYTGVNSSFFRIGNVPLFTGFMYSAVGSYIVRSFEYLKLEFKPWPSSKALGIISFFIYTNFFSHHYIFDFRYFILFFIFLLLLKPRFILK